MAKVEIRFPDEYLERLSKLGTHTDEITSHVLVSGGKVVLEKVKRNLAAVVGKGTKEPSRSTGELVSSLGLSPARMDANGNTDIKIGFREGRKDGESNAKIANILEHGRSNQPAKPFLKPAISSCKEEAVQAMKRTFEEEVGKL